MPSNAGGQQGEWLARTINLLDAATHPHRALFFAAVGVVAASLVSGLFMYLKGRFTAQASESIARSLRMRLYDHLQHLPVAYHDKCPTGDQVQRCTSDVDTVRMLYASQTVEIAHAMMLLVSSSTCGLVAPAGSGQSIRFGGFPGSMTTTALSVGTTIDSR